MTSENTVTLPTNVSTTLNTFVAAAKKAFADAKKHVKDVVKRQAERLYEAPGGTSDTGW